MAETKKTLHCFLTCFQSSGRIGNSTELEGIISWAKFAGIPVAAADCDAALQLFCLYGFLAKAACFAKNTKGQPHENQHL